MDAFGAAWSKRVKPGGAAAVSDAEGSVVLRRDAHPAQTHRNTASKRAPEAARTKRATLLAQKPAAPGPESNMALLSHAAVSFGASVASKPGKRGRDGVPRAGDGRTVEEGEIPRATGQTRSGHDQLATVCLKRGSSKFREQRSRLPVMHYASDIASALQTSPSGAIVIVGETGSGKTTRESWNHQCGQVGCSTQGFTHRQPFCLLLLSALTGSPCSWCCRKRRRSASDSARGGAGRAPAAPTRQQNPKRPVHCRIAASPRCGHHRQPARGCRNGHSDWRCGWLQRSV